MHSAKATSDALAGSDSGYAPLPSGHSVAKHIKFGWSEPGQKPRFEWIDKRKLLVDHENYQRPYSHQRSINMAREFSWQRFEVLTVVRRPDITLYVVEGQHRLRAALLRADVSEVPCLVYDADDIREEAKAFVEIGTGSKHLTSFDRFQPSVTMGDASALLVQGLLDAANLRASDTASAQGVKCVGLLQRLATIDGKALVAAWPLIVEVHQGEALHSRLVDAVFYLWRLSEGTIDKDPYRKRLVNRGRASLLADANTAALFYEKGGAKIWASGIAKVMNKGLQEGRRIEVFGQAAAEAEAR